MSTVDDSAESVFGARLHWSTSTWLLVVVVCGAVFLDALDISMIGVALPSIGRSLHLSAGSLQWIVSGYVLGYGGLLLLGGRASDLIGRRSVFLTAVTVFGLASVVSAFLGNDLALIVLRFVKGASAAFTVPAGLSIITTTFAEGPEKSRALSIYSLAGACGFSLGLVFGGILTEVGWRTTFLVPGPVALVLVAAGSFILPKAEPLRSRLREFDLLGAFTSTFALLTLVYTVVEAPARGWASLATTGGLAISLALFVIFVRIEQRHPRPLLRLGILRSSSLGHANLVGAAMFGSYVSLQFVATLYFQDSLRWSPIEMGLGFLPGGIIVIVASTRTAALLERYDTTRLIAVGLALLTTGFLLFLRASPSLSYPELLLPTMLFIGSGFALTFPAVASQATAGVVRDEQGLASGLVNTSIQVGGAIGLAITTAIIGTRNATGESGELLPGMRTALTVSVGIALLGFAATGARLIRMRRDSEPADLAPDVLPSQES